MNEEKASGARAGAGSVFHDNEDSDDSDGEVDIGTAMSQSSHSSGGGESPGAAEIAAGSGGSYMNPGVTFSEAENQSGAGKDARSSNDNYFLNDNSLD
jgi:hypothetical protein